MFRAEAQAKSPQAITGDGSSASASSSAPPGVSSGFLFVGFLLLFVVFANRSRRCDRIQLLCVRRVAAQAQAIAAAMAAAGAQSSSSSSSSSTSSSSGNSGAVTKSTTSKAAGEESKRLKNLLILHSEHTTVMITFNKMNTLYYIRLFQFCLNCNNC